jgi:uncharacterized protein with HEPN domain
MGIKETYDYSFNEKEKEKICEQLQFCYLCYGKINEYLDGVDRNTFLGHKMCQDACYNNIRSLTDTLKNLLHAYFNDPNCPMFKHTKKIRNTTYHEYRKHNPEIIWTILQTELAPVFEAMEEIRACMEQV